MNLLLIRRDEIHDRKVTLRDRRAAHCLKVLHAKAGETLRAAVENEGPCSAKVASIDGDSVSLFLGEVTPVAPPRLHVALAIPRPKGLSRIVSAIASFGVHRLTLYNAWKVEKSYFDSARLEPSRLTSDLRLGAEQGRQPWVPEFQVVPTFREFVGQTLSESPVARFVFDPSGQTDLNGALARAGYSGANSALEALLVFGPDGGFIEQELTSFAQAGLELVRLNTGPLRTEVAVAAALGQWALATSRSETPAS